jgi:hypothetical protein
MTSHKFLRALCAPSSVPSVVKIRAARATLTTTISRKPERTSN